MLRSSLINAAAVAALALSFTVSNAQTARTPQTPEAASTTPTPPAADAAAEGRANILTQIVITAVRRRAEDVQATPGIILISRLIKNGVFAVV
jgi:hypothetical protein